MFKIKLANFLLINVILVLGGLIAILTGIVLNGAILRPLLESVGTGLLAAGAINILDRIFTVESSASPAAPPPPSLKERIVLAAETRVAISKEILDLKFEAVKVDLIGVTLNSALEELVKDRQQRIINNLLFHNLQLRLFLVHPHSQYMLQRAIEDNWEQSKLVSRQVEVVRLCAQFYEQLARRYEEAKKKGKLDTRFTGSLQIKLLEFCPYVSIYRINDDRIYWGPYLSGGAGMNLPLYVTTTERDPDLYSHLHDHIHGLMERDTKYPDLVRMTNVGKPALNDALLKSITAG